MNIEKIYVLELFANGKNPKEHGSIYGVFSSYDLAVSFLNMIYPRFDFQFEDVDKFPGKVWMYTHYNGDWTFYITEIFIDQPVTRWEDTSTKR